MSSYGNIIDLIRVPYLDLHAFAEWRKQLSEDDLLVPDRFITAFLDWSFPLETHKGVTLKSQLSFCANVNEVSAISLNQVGIFESCSLSEHNVFMLMSVCMAPWTLYIVHILYGLLPSIHSSDLARKPCLFRNQEYILYYTVTLEMLI